MTEKKRYTRFIDNYEDVYIKTPIGRKIEIGWEDDVFVDSIDKVVALLNEKDERIKQLEQMNANLVKKYVIDFETKYPDYEPSEGYTSTVEQDIRFEERTREALERVEKANKKGMPVDKFLQELEKW